MLPRSLQRTHHSHVHVLALYPSSTHLKHQVLVPLAIPLSIGQQCSSQSKGLRARQEGPMFKHKKPLMFSQIYIFIKAKVYVILEGVMETHEKSERHDPLFEQGLNL